MRQFHLCQHAADVLRDEIIDRFRLVIEGRNRGHNDRASLLRTHGRPQQLTFDRDVVCFPRIDARVVSGHTADTLARLAAGELDVALLPLPVDAEKMRMVYGVKDGKGSEK